MIIQLLKLCARIRRDTTGAVGTEYAFLIAFIAIVAAAGMLLLGNELTGFFTTIGESLQGIGGNIPDPFGGGEEAPPDP